MNLNKGLVIKLPDQMKLTDVNRVKVQFLPDFKQCVVTEYINKDGEISFSRRKGQYAYPVVVKDVKIYSRQIALGKIFVKEVPASCVPHLALDKVNNRISSYERWIQAHIVWNRNKSDSNFDVLEGCAEELDNELKIPLKEGHDYLFHRDWKDDMFEEMYLKATSSQGASCSNMKKCFMLFLFIVYSALLILGTMMVTTMRMLNQIKL